MAVMVKGRPSACDSASHCPRDYIEAMDVDAEDDETMEMTKTFSMTPWIENTHSYLTLMSAFGTKQTCSMR